jgi:hypothetical protein
MTDIGSEISGAALQIEGRRARVRRNTQRMRARRKQSFRCVTIRLAASEIERLIGAGYLAANFVHDGSAGAQTIRAAVEAFLADHL